MSGEKIDEYVLDVTGVTDYEPIADLWENVRLDTAAEAHAGVNTRQVWASGTANFATGKIHIEGYRQ